MRVEHVSIVVAGLLIASVLASKAAVRLRIPSLVLFVLLGILAGSEGIGGIYFDDALMAQWVGTIALLFILFAAGLETKWHQVRPVLAPGLSLATAGVLVSAAIMMLFCHYALQLSYKEALLLGSVVSSTDAAAVFTVLRSQGIGLKNDVQRVIEFESGSNDPVAVLLTLSVIQLIGAEGLPLAPVLGNTLMQLAVGAVAGYAFGRLMLFGINRIRLEWEGLYPVLSLALALLTFGLSSALRGSGFLAIYLAGIVLGNAYFVHRRSLRLFHDALAWVMQIVVFLTLGLLVFPSQLIRVSLAGIAVSAFLVFVARPASVFVALAYTRFNWKEKLFISWAGLRGAVPIVLATFALVAGLERAHFMFNVVFFTALLSLVVQAATIPTVARLTGVAAPLVPVRAYPIEFNPTHGIKSDLMELEVMPDSAAAGKRIVDLGLPKSALITLMSRGSEFVVPKGDTELLPGDVLLVLADDAASHQLRVLTGNNNAGGPA